MFWRKRQARVHLKDNQPSIEGVLVERPGAFYRLEQAKALAESGQELALDGTTYVPKENVIFWQEVTAT